MTQVFFYHGAADRAAAACALLTGAYAKRRPVLVYVPEKSLAQSVDRMLWAHNALSFIPHCAADSPLASETSILVADSLDAPPSCERLMNLSHEIPPEHQRFSSIIEVVGQAEDARLAARERVRWYKSKGCEVQYFDLSNR